MCNKKQARRPPLDPVHIPKDKPVVRVLMMVTREFEFTPDEITFITTRNPHALCNGCNEEVGEDNPKASCSVGGRYFVLCKKCWTSQGIKQ